ALVPTIDEPAFEAPLHAGQKRGRALVTELHHSLLLHQRADGRFGFLRAVIVGIRDSFWVALALPIAQQHGRRDGTAALQRAISATLGPALLRLACLDAILTALAVVNQ